MRAAAEVSLFHATGACLLVFLRRISAPNPHASIRPLECPITVFAGDNDSVFNFEQIQAWKTYTKENFSFKEIEGRHLFLNENKEVLLKMISEELE